MIVYSNHRLAAILATLIVAVDLTACARFNPGERARAVERLREIDGYLADLDDALPQ